MLIIDCRTRTNTERHRTSPWEVLLDLGFTWDRVVIDVWTEEDRFGRAKEKHGIHHYYMLGDKDVAYYTPLMDTLHIHPSPRLWGESALRKTKAVGPGSAHYTRNLTTSRDAQP